MMSDESNLVVAVREGETLQSTRKLMDRLSRQPRVYSGPRSGRPAYNSRQK